MVLNVVFLAGGICIGYLLRGEIDRRKSKKAWVAAVEEGIKVVEGLAKEIANKTEEDEDENIIDLGFLNDFKSIDDDKDSSNFTDETIKL